MSGHSVTIEAWQALRMAAQARGYAVTWVALGDGRLTWYAARGGRVHRLGDLKAAQRFIRSAAAAPLGAAHCGEPREPRTLRPKTNRTFSA